MGIIRRHEAEVSSDVVPTEDVDDLLRAETVAIAHRSERAAVADQVVTQVFPSEEPNAIGDTRVRYKGHRSVGQVGSGVDHEVIGRSTGALPRHRAHPRLLFVFFPGQVDLDAWLLAAFLHR